jgi:hypothetical protein
MLQDLLFAMVITTMLTLALTATMFAVVRTLGGTTSRIDQSNGATLFASYFGPDVQNAVTVTPNAVEGSNCPSPRAVDLLLTSDGSSSVSYFRGTGADASVLFRRTCVGGTSSTPQRLTRFVVGAPTFTCAPSGCDAAWRTITASITQYDAHDPLNASKRYTTNIDGTRRGL